MVTARCKDREVGTNPGQKRLRYRGVQGMKYSYERATWWLAILTVPKPYDGVLYNLLFDAIAGSLCEVLANTWV